MELMKKFNKLIRRGITKKDIFGLMLKLEDIENYSGIKSKLGSIPRLRKGYWKQLDFFPGGDAPKSFIAFYNYEEDSSIRKNNMDTWPRYIAKVGHKWYPIESINEFLFNQIGEVLGLRMAKSMLLMAGTQLRFLSRYFLKKDESLIHGAEIFAGYLSDKQFVENIEIQGLARKFFTFQFAESAIRDAFPNQAEHILLEFVKMIVFDAITGNNDRHFYNWGVVKDIGSKKTPIFAPVYDSARGLFWNDSESKLEDLYRDEKQIEIRVRKYCEGSRPKIGWDGLDELNHFDLINSIFSTDARYKDVCRGLINEDNLRKIRYLVDTEFFDFYSEIRRDLIKRCLIHRFKRLTEIVCEKN